MKQALKEFLFTKHILVGGEESENAFEVLFTLANKFNIRVTEGERLVTEEHIFLADEMLGAYVPEPFYRGFPATVRALSPDALLFDQLAHYFRTYTLGDFSEAGHSLFEEKLERLAFKEQTEIKKFTVLSEEDAVSRLAVYVEDLLSSTRPLGDEPYEMLSTYISEYGYQVKVCACKDTAIRLLLDKEDVAYADLLSLSDVIKLVDILNYTRYGNDNIKKLNLRNRDRKLIAGVIDRLFEQGRRNVRECFEKKALWCGLLHHIHYKPKCAEAEEFLALMRGKENRSVYAAFERAMLEKDIRKAVETLKAGKGAGALLRNLNYVVSRCESEEDVAFVLDSLETDNVILLVQLLMQYENYVRGGHRTLKFTRYNKLRVHTETDEEFFARRSALAEEQVDALSSLVREKLKTLLHGRLGKVYISPDMERVALPLQENTASGGYGVLSKGTRIPIERGKKIRAFTYWEEVDDIDLGVIGIKENGEQEEFSWRTMYGKQSIGITYSGDETSGYEGGSEYFDIDVPVFKAEHPEIKYLVFCNNVFSDKYFSECHCKAGYMLRDTDDSGEVFEPKTVKSSFRIDGESTFAYLFGIDLEESEFVWLNLTRDSEVHVAGATEMQFLVDYFKSTRVLNLASFFGMLASELTDTPAEADVAVTDEELSLPEGSKTEIIHSYDFERILALLNGKSE